MIDIKKSEFESYLTATGKQAVIIRDRYNNALALIDNLVFCIYDYDYEVSQ